jgi:hypothetical protein
LTPLKRNYPIKLCALIFDYVPPLHVQNALIM